jgi:ATP-dependent 26S proteasome regulatory subunit
VSKSQLLKQMTELETLIRARYPVLYLVSWEEKKVERLMSRIAARRKKKVYTWSVTQGIQPLGAVVDPSKAKSSSTRDPSAALDHVLVSNESAIFLFMDFHPFLTKQNFAIVRKMREVAQTIKNSYKTLVIVSPVLELPVELEKELTVMQMALPGPDEFNELLERIIREVKDNPNVTVRVDEASRERVIKAAMGLTLAEAENVFAKTIVADGVLDSNDVSAIFAEKQQIIRKSGLLEYYEAQEDFGGVGGLGALKDWLAKRARAFTDEAAGFGLPAPKGILLLGVQGCGKSLCAKAAASHWKLPLLRFDIGKMFGSLVGSSEENMRRAIQVAESVAPAVLWVDEIDKAFAGVSGSGGSDAGTSSRVFGTFLTWLSEKQSPVFVLATANDISNLPPELLRKGRLDEIFFVDLPNADERKEIVEIHVSKRGRSSTGYDLARLVEASKGFSGAELEQAVISALYDAFYAGTELTGEGLLAAIEETVPLSRTMQEEIESLRAWAGTRARRATPPKPEVGASNRRRIEF